MLMSEIVVEQPFGVYEGKAVSAYRLSNANGLVARLTNFGARLIAMMVPDRDGISADVVLGFDDLAAYAESNSYFGATCGRYGNRIKRGRLVLGGRPIDVSRNDGPNHLHGGFKGFDRQIWDGEIDQAENSISFSLVSEDGDEGFPGRLVARSKYCLTDDDRLIITMTASSDQETVVNLVHHSYWNLAGHDSGDVLDQLLQVNAEFYTPVDDELIPTGEILAVAGTAFDFREEKAIGREGGRYDNNWVISDFGPGLRPVAALHDPKSGRTMELRSSEPGVQIYTAGYIDPPVVGKGGQLYRRYSGVTFETQKFPDSPNFAHFPDARLQPGEVYEHCMEIRFLVR
jgi:aldose 1-epimerase